MYVSGSRWRTGRTCFRLVLSALWSWAGHPSLPPSLTWREWIQLDYVLCLRYIHLFIRKTFPSGKYVWFYLWMVRLYQCIWLSPLRPAWPKFSVSLPYKDVDRSTHKKQTLLCLCLSAAIKCVKRNWLNICVNILFSSMLKKVCSMQTSFYMIIQPCNKNNNTNK